MPEQQGTWQTGQPQGGQPFGGPGPYASFVPGQRQQPGAWAGPQQNQWNRPQQTPWQNQWNPPQWQSQTYQGTWADPRGPRTRHATAGRVVIFAAAVVVGLTALFFVLGMMKSSGAPAEPQVDYKNENYLVPAENLRPPALPRPGTESHAKEWITANSLYSNSVASPIRCELGNFNYGSSSESELEEHLNLLMTCVLRLWGPTLESAGYTPVRPHVTVHSRPIKNKCGETPMPNASYCAADQQIYVSSDLLRIVPASLREKRFMIDLVLAHEFGHAVQGRSGILLSSLILEYKNPDSPEANQLSRRTEMQADCFAGMFMNAISQATKPTEAEKRALGEMISSLGDDVLSGQDETEFDHGSGANRRRWLETGLSSTSVSSCNTFTADAGAVR